MITSNIYNNCIKKIALLLPALLFFQSLQAAPKVGSCTVGSQSPVSVAAGNTATYLITVNRGSGQGSNGSFNVNLSITSTLPQGVTAQFTSSSLSFSGSSNSMSTTLSLITNITTPGGTFPFTVRAQTTTSDFATGNGTLNVCEVITSSPASITACENSSAIFNVTATGSGLIYKWRKNGVLLSDNATISGSASAQLTLSSVTTGTAGNYDVVVTNNCGTDTSDIATLTVNQLPVVTCPANITTLTSANSCGANVSFTATAGGNPAPAITYSALPGSFFATGSHTVNVTATNACGTSNCSFTINVTDQIPPVAVCKNITIALDANGQASITPAMINDGSSDNCGIASMSVSPNSFNCSNAGSNTVTLSVTDVNGNISTCNSVVTITESPVALCKNIIVQLDQNGQAVINPSDVDNGSSAVCGIASMSVSPNSFNCNNTGLNNVVLVVTSSTGSTASCTAVVDVQENIVPVAICKNITLPLNSSGIAVLNSAQINDGSTDACGIASMILSQENFDCSNIGANNVLLTVTDVNGNFSTCTATVNVIDNIDPSVVCQNISVSLDNSGSATITPAQIVSGSADACGIASMSVLPNTFSCSETGNQNVTLTVTDVNGNSAECNALVTISDPVAPTAVCKNITVQLNNLGTATITAADINDGSTDACGIASMTLSQYNFDCTMIGANTVTLTVTDVNGNSASCNAIVTVSDLIAPVAVCKNISVQLNNMGNATITATDINDGSTDACGIASMILSQYNFDCTMTGANTVTLTVTDVNGHSASCNAVVTVSDLVPPMAVCKNISVQLDNLGTASINAGDVNDSSTDACGIASMTLSQYNFDCTMIGANTVTLTVTDFNGNSTSCNAIVTVSDIVAPVAVCRNINVQLDNLGTASITAADINNGSTDACGNITSMTVSPTSFTCADIGNQNVTLTVTDGNGNSSTCSSVVIVSDLVAPVAVCKNISVQLNNVGTASITAADINDGSTDACGIATMTLSQYNFDCTMVGANNVTLTVTDVNGNSASCNAIVTVSDLIAPVAVCKNISVQLNNLGTASITGIDINDGSVDACGIASMTLSQYNFDCTMVGANTITLTVTDVNGNSSSCNAVVTVSDQIAPVAVCKNITVQLNNLGAASITAADINDGSTDACGIASMTLSQYNFDCTMVGSNTVTLTVTDVNGNSSNCSAIVTVSDLVAPVAVCKNITVQLNNLGTASITAADINDGSTDACGIASMTLSQYNFDCTMIGANTVTLTVTDVNGNSSSCNAVVTVSDLIAPVAVCKNIAVQLNNLGAASITAADINDGSTDACGIASMTLSQYNFDCTMIGANTVTLTVTDVNGNSSTCSAVVTVSDLIAPVAVCKNITVQLNNLGTASITAADINDGSTDACGIENMTLSQNNFDCTMIGANNVILTVTDVNGNSSSCNAIVTVSDLVAPIAVCKNITVQLNNMGTASITAADINDGSTDACGIASMTLSQYNFDCTMIGANTVILTVTDINGNSSTCAAIVTVSDLVGPIAVCKNITVQLNNLGTASITAADINDGSTDACGIASMTLSQYNFDCTMIGANTITLTVTDANGNSSTCSAVVTVSDLIAPVAVCKNIPVQLNNLGTASITAADINDGSTDACGIASMTLSQYNFDCTMVGANTVTLTVTDINGNSSSCSSVVTVSDLVAPVAVCKNITIQLNHLGTASITAADINDGSTDACGIASLTLSQYNFNCSMVGANTVVFTVTDVNGNSSTCSSVVTVSDQIAPVAVCKNLSVQLNNLGTASITAADINDGSTDACGIATMILSQYNFDCTMIGANTVTLIVTDANGNSSTCSAVVTVSDLIAPVAVCKNITVQLNNLGTASITAADINDGSTDACGIASMTLSQYNFDCTMIGANTVTLTVTDVNGNSASCNAVVTVSDQVAPVTVCKNISVQLNNLGTASITAADINDGSTDACGIASMTLSQYNFDCTMVGANTVTLTVTDVNGNSTSCNAVVTVSDLVAPVAVCKNITVQLNNLGAAPITAADINDGSTDACGIASMTLSQYNFDCTMIGANTVTLTVTDVNGNSASCNAVVTIFDLVAPVAVCKNITVQLNNLGTASITATDINDGSTDACGIASMTLSQYNFDCTMVGANTVTLTVTDVNGNSSSCNALVTVSDQVAPVAVCKNIAVQLNSLGTASITAGDINDGSTDICGIASLTLSQYNFDCTMVGANTVTLTVTDVNGNSSTCSAIVTISDQVAPVAVCKNITVQLNNLGTASITAADINDGSTDACGIATMTLSQYNFDCTMVGANNVTLTVTDVNGNSASCNAIVTVSDLIAPVAVCKNISVQLNNLGTASITGIDINDGSVDACGIASMTLSQYNFDCTMIGANNVTLTVTDVNGNSSSCNAIVTVSDLVAPVAVCKNFSVQLNNLGTASITAADINDGSTDACGIATMTLSQYNFDCTMVGANIVTLTVTDVNGNTSSCSSVVTVSDLVAPVAVCKNITVQLNNLGTASITAADINDGSTDACGIANMTLSQYNFDCTMIGANTVTLTVTDVNGNSTSCNAVVTVSDQVAPVTVCKNISIQLNNLGTASITAADINDGSTDACGIASLTLSQYNFECTMVGANTVTLTVTDVNGNSSTCSSVVTVSDQVAPVAVCKNITLQLNNLGTASITAADINDGSTDACGIASMTLSQYNFDCTMIGANTVTLTVTDVNGNSSTCSAMVTVSDLVAPVAICKNITVLLDNLGNASITAADINNGSNDACGIATLTISNQTFDCSNIGNNNVTLTVTDNNGNSSSCSSIVTVVDNIAPVVNCNNLTIQLDQFGMASITAAQLNNGSADPCGITSLSVSQSTFNCSHLGENKVFLTVTDNNGNSAVCEGFVTVEDVTPPQALCKNVTVYLNAGGTAEIIAADVNNGSSDVCGIQSLSLSSSTFNCTQTGANAITLTATDHSGNSSSCTSTVTVLDTLSPVFQLINNITVNYNPSACGTVVNYAVIASDNCSFTVNQTQGLADGAVFPLGTTVNTFVATDASGNSSSVTFTVTVLPVATSLYLSSSVPTAQYSDVVSFTAIIYGGATTCNLQAAQLATFRIGSYQLGTAPFVPSGADLIAILSSVPMKASGLNTSVFAPGNKTVIVDLTGFAPQFIVTPQASIPLTITQENAMAVYTGMTFVSTSSVNSGSAVVTIAATILDATASLSNTNYDPFAGDIRNAKVTFINRDNNSIIASNLPVTLVNSADEKVATVVYNWPVNIGNANSVSYTVGIIVTDYYTDNNADENTVVTVAKPLNDFIAGGGHIIIATPAGSKGADIGSKNNFGFNVKYNRSNTNLQGNINCIIRKTEIDGVHTYQIKGNNLTSLSVNSASGKAQLAGKANVQDITDPQNPISMFGNATFQVKATDLGEPGSSDSISFVLYHPQTGLWFASNWNGSSGVEQVLDAGNIRVANRIPARVSEENENTVSVLAQQNGISLNQNYPNPAVSVTTLEFTLPSDGKAELQLFNLNGSMIKVIASGTFSAGQVNSIEVDVNDLVTGTYFYRLISEGLSETKRMIVVK
jgi:hypothetical protein